MSVGLWVNVVFYLVVVSVMSVWWCSGSLVCGMCECFDVGGDVGCDWLVVCCVLVDVFGWFVELFVDLCVECVGWIEYGVDGVYFYEVVEFWCEYWC